MIFGIIVMILFISDMIISGFYTYQIIGLTLSTIFIGLKILKKLDIKMELILIAISVIIFVTGTILMHINNDHQVVNAEKLIAKNELESAYVILKDLQDTQSSNIEVFYLMGLIYKKQYKYSEMIEAFKKGYQSTPSHYKSSVELIDYYIRNSNYTDARKICESLMNDYPEDAYLYEIMGDCCDNSSTDHGAVYYYKAASIQENPSPLVFAKLGYYYGKYNDMDTANAYFKQAEEGLETMPEYTAKVLYQKEKLSEVLQ